MIAAFLVLLFPVVESQYFSQPGFRPDITFNDDNDRFDVKPLLNLQNSYYNAYPSIRRHNGDNLGQNRREWIRLKADGPEAGEEAKEIINDVKKNIFKEIDKLADLIARTWKRNGGDVVRNEYKNSYLKANINDFISRKTLGNVLIDVGGRRSGDVRKSVNRSDFNVGREATFNYAFPISLVLRGYLLPPSAV